MRMIVLLVGTCQLAGCAGDPVLRQQLRGLQVEMGIVREQLKEQRKLIHKLQALQPRQKPRSFWPGDSPAAKPLDFSRSIRQTGPYQFEIDREVLNKVLSDTTRLARSARIVPAVKAGKPSGFKLFAIRPGSLYAAMQLKNGDTITAVNGLAITTPDKALEVYTQMRNATRITLSIERQGSPLTLSYQIK